MTQPITGKVEVPLTGKTFQATITPLSEELLTKNKSVRSYRLKRFIEKLHVKGFVYQYNINAIKNELGVLR